MAKSEARQILDMQLVKGEISEEDYKRKCELLGPEEIELIRPAPVPHRQPFVPIQAHAGLPFPGLNPDTIGAEPASDSFLLRDLWHGRQPLWLTFWAWGIGWSVFLAVVTWIVGNATAPGSFAALIRAAYLGWLIFILVSTLRSARNHKRLYPEAAWQGRAAQLAIISLMVIASLMVLEGIEDGWFLPHNPVATSNLEHSGEVLPGTRELAALENGIATIRKSLPQFVDDKKLLRMDDIFMDGWDVVISLTMINVERAFTPNERDGLATMAARFWCSDENRRQLSSFVSHVVLNFQTKSLQPAAHVTFDKGTCPGLKS